MIIELSMCMFGVFGATGAIVAAGVLGAGASLAAGMMASDAQSDANDQNEANAQADRLMNKAMFDESRGSKGSAFLPIYAKDSSGNPVEPLIFDDTMDLYNFWNNSTPEEQAAKYRTAIQRYQLAQAGADKTANSIFDGSLVNEVLDANAPVEKARLEVAASRKNAGIEALQKTLNSIKALQAKRGFTGDSFGNRLLSTSVMRDVNTQAATDLGEANLANATDQAQIRKNGAALRVSNLNLPYTMARQAADMADLPENLALDQNNRRLQVFAPFRIGTSTFKYDPLPQVTPVAGIGQIAAQAGAGLAGSLGNVAASNYLANQNFKNTSSLINQMQKAPTTVPTAAITDWA